MSRLSVAVLVVAVVLVTLCDARLIHDLAAANQGAAMETDYLANCPCSNKALCAPLTLGPRPELLMFQVSGENYMRYNWSKVFRFHFLWLLYYRYRPGAAGLVEVGDRPSEAGPILAR